MFKQSLLRILPGLLLVAVGYVGGMLAVSHAQLYVGGSLGKAYQYGIGDQPSDHSACASTYDKQTFPVGSLFAGYRLGYVGIEGGAGSLFHSRFGGDCPWSLGSQDIKASYRYLRVNGFIPLPLGIDLIPFAGLASVKFTNYEVQDYRAPTYTPEHVTNYTTGKETSPFVGVGLQKSVGNFFGRIEIQQMQYVAEDYWTARGFHNSVKTVSVGIGRYF